MMTMLDAHFGDVGRGHGKAGAQQRSPPRSESRDRTLVVTHMQPLPPADSLRLGTGLFTAYLDRAPTASPRSTSPTA